MSDIITIALCVIILPTILVVLSPLIDQILTDEVIDFLNDGIDGIEYVIWSTNTNLLFCCIWLLIVMPMVRWFISFITGNNKDD